MSERRGIPTARNVDHLAYTVPNLDEAVAFFIDVLGCSYLYEVGPLEFQDSDWMREHLDVHPRARLRHVLLRCGPVTNIELFEYDAPDQSKKTPSNSDVGGHHIAFFVDDLEAAAEYLRAQPGVIILGNPTHVDAGPSAGLEFLYFKTPWGMSMELVRHPAKLPYEDTVEDRHFGPVENWNERDNRSISGEAR